MARHFFDGRFSNVDPPLTDERHHPDQCMGVDWRRLRVVAGAFEGRRELIAHPLSQVVQ
jgi:hypothetical protein